MHFPDRWPALLACVALLCVASPLPAATPAVALDAHVAADTVRDIRLSPDGAHFAMAAAHDGQVGLVIRRRQSGETTAVLRFGRDTHVDDFWWVSPDRVVVSLSEAFGTRDKPTPTGELFAIDADGSGRQALVGRAVEGVQPGSRLGTHKARGDVMAFIIDPRANAAGEILVAVHTLLARDTSSTVERMNVRTGDRRRITKSPVGLASYVADNAGRARFALGADTDGYSQLHHRAGDDAEWQRINHQRESGEVVVPLGFSADDSAAYLRITQASGPDRIAVWTPADGRRELLPGDPLLDPVPVRLDGSGRPIGVRYLEGPSRFQPFDPAAPESRLQRSLAAAFPGQDVRILSSTDDGRFKVLLVGSDIDPGSFYFFDTVAKRADLILARKAGIDPRRMAKLEPVSLPARDGLRLHGWLAKPAGAGGPLPMVVLPHGGPFEVFDGWEFDDDTQLLAQAGYAVLRVNFRGSGNYGHAFTRAGAREWGGKMQDDLTDATRWAIDRGIADPARICIYGASYGGYAALMGAAKAPDLYRCAVGYVGVYDLPRVHAEDGRGLRARRSWSRDWIGDDRATLAKVSPVNLADRITAPVLLVAGGEDPIAPIEHTEAMAAALRRAGRAPETWYVRTEGHGFHLPAHRREFYRRLLDFLGTHLGGARAGGD